MIKVKIGRNDPCPCGSGKKYKKCCLDKPFEPSPELLADFELGQRLVAEMEAEAAAKKEIPSLSFQP